jgi:hypothetical protein
MKLSSERDRILTQLVMDKNQKRASSLDLETNENTPNITLSMSSITDNKIAFIDLKSKFQVF